MSEYKSFATYERLNNEITHLRAENKKLREQLRGEIESHQAMTKAYEYENEKLRARAVPIPESVEKIIDDYPAICAERDRMRALLVCLYDAAGPLDADKMPADDFAQIITIVLDARAAIEGVTEPVALWQHKKTGGVYEIVGECQIEATNAPGVLYRNTSTGVTWMRPKEEFFDGRFVEWRKSEP